MDEEKNVPSPEETTEKALTVDNLNDHQKKKRHKTFRLLAKIVCFAYFLWFIHTNEEKIQAQEMSEFSASYIYPVVFWFAVPLSFIPPIPFALLHFLAVSDSTHPVIRNGSKKSMIVSIFINVMYCLNMTSISNIITRSMYCYYCFFYKSNLTDDISWKLFTILYSAILYFISDLWADSIMISYNSVLDTVTIYKFAIL